jgi:DNA-binding transcriptional ArsR family regulator
MMPDLVEGVSPRKVDYAVSLPLSLLATAGLLCATPRFEGLGDWLREARAQLPADLRDELCLLITFPGRYQRFTAELVPHLPKDAAEMDYDRFLAHLRSIPGVFYQRMALRALAKGAATPPSTADLLDLAGRPGEWAAYLASIESEARPEDVATLVRDGDQLKERLIYALDRFWADLYAEEFAATRYLMERSVVHHQAQAYGMAFSEVFAAVTGRLVPEGIANLLPDIVRVTFVPSCYVGPYVAYTHVGDELLLYYNCRSTPAGLATADSAALYPPIKALADETRLQIVGLLQGREMYAQEIVDQLDISQPAVSRHLNLMVTAGVLQTRREGNAKYYSIDGETLIRIADALRAFV